MAVMHGEAGSVRRDRWLRGLIVVWTLVGAVVLVAGAGWLIARVSRALVPLAIAVVVVLVLRGPVHRLERRGVRRGWAVGLLYLVALLGIAFAGLFIVPPVSAQIGRFVDDFPRYYEAAYSFGQDLLAQYREVAPEWLEDASQDIYQGIGAQFSRLSSDIARGALAAGTRVAEVIIDLLLGLVMGFWLLKDLPAIREEILLLAGPKNRQEAQVVSHQVTTVLGGYLRGLFIVCAMTGVLITVGLWISGVPYPLVLGLLGGILNVVPYVGPAVTAAVASIAGAFVNPWLALAAVVVVFAAQQITDLLVTPRVMSEQVDLHPVLVILSLLIGATLFGVWGLVLAIPFAAAGKGLFVYFFEKYTRSTLRSEGGALFRQPRCEPDSSVGRRVPSGAGVDSAAGDDTSGDHGPREAAEDRD